MPRRQNLRPLILGILLMAAAPLSGCIAATPALMGWTTATFASPIRPPAWIRGEWGDQTGIISYSFTADDVITKGSLGTGSFSGSLKDAASIQVQASKFRIWDEATDDSYTIHYEYSAGSNTSGKFDYSFKRVGSDEISVVMIGIDLGVKLKKQ